MSDSTTLLPFQPRSMSTAQLAAVSYLARYSGHTQELYAYQLRRWFAWRQINELDPLVGIQRAHFELYIRQLGETGLMVSSVTTMMHGVRGFFRFAHIDGLIAADPAVYASTLGSRGEGGGWSELHAHQHVGGPAEPARRRRLVPRARYWAGATYSLLPRGSPD
jgi:Phage integrase, N-terminal SAM-like domain